MAVLSARSRTEPSLTSTTRTWRSHGGCVVLLTVLGVLLNEKVWFHGLWSTQTLSQRGDVAEQLWFLGVIPHLLFSGHSIFHTDLAFAGSGGVNLMANTSLFGPALLLSPFTQVSGPITSLNVALLLAPVLSGWAMFTLATRFTTSNTVALAGAVFYGFSPALLNHLRLGHLQLTFACVIPLAGVLAVDLVRGTRSPRRTGVLAAVLICLQYSIGAEMLAIEALGMVALIVAALLVDRAWLRSVTRRGLAALPLAVLLSALVLAVPISYELFGYRHFTGAPWGNVAEGVGLADFVDPGASTSILGWVPATFGNLGPDGLPINFLGYGIVATLLVIVVTLRHDRRVKVLALATSLLVICNLGKQLTIRRGDFLDPVTHWWPWRMAMKFPVLEQLTVSRLSFFIDATVALLLVLGWSHLLHVLAQREVERRLRGVALALALLVAFVPITATQALPLASGNDGQANAWVTSFGQHLSHGERVLFFPYPSPPPGLAAALAWQAEAKFSYSILGGYLATPSEPTTASNFLVPPRGEEGALIATGAEFGPSPQSKFNLRLLARAINHRHPTTIVVVPTIQYGPQYAATVTALLGRVPGVKGHTLVWRNVTGAAVHRGDGEVIAHCSATVHSIDLRAVPHCVVVGQHQRQR